MKVANFPSLYRHVRSGRYYACKKLGGVRRESSGSCDNLAVGSTLLGRFRFDQLISSNLAAIPGSVRGARWMQGGTGQPGDSMAMRQRLPNPKGKWLCAGQGSIVQVVKVLGEVFKKPCVVLPRRRA